MGHRALRLSGETVQQLERWARSSTLPHRQVVRSQILLRLSAGEAASEVARTLGVSRETVRRWRDRAAREGVETLLRDRPGRGRRRGRSASVVARVLDTLARHPSWTLRAVAARAHTSAATVQRIRRDHTRADEGGVSRQLLKREPTLSKDEDGKPLASSSCEYLPSLL